MMLVRFQDEEYIALTAFDKNEIVLDNLVLPFMSSKSWKRGHVCGHTSS
jgi:hypothetical protein